MNYGSNISAHSPKTLSHPRLKTMASPTTSSFSNGPLMARPQNRKRRHTDESSPSARPPTRIKSPGERRATRAKAQVLRRTLAEHLPHQKGEACLRSRTRYLQQRRSSIPPIFRQPLGISCRTFGLRLVLCESSIDETRQNQSPQTWVRPG